ncbi:hypothetical protein [Pontibacter sp. SGAir0037]|uniref:hypothetical protein n=1 Tax=Pontibacter sp. SGAir0037 TaxID=2571030 RepID=UPI0010CD55F5|nr:hypothetical protein [Pontibacter sp. SGAir0037]QCR23926.1 hypothetical protein C1N53_17265 [Pontibacter sp. SGAir0037]
MSDQETMSDVNHVQHMFLHVESSDAICILNVAGHPYRLRELIYMMIENGCRVMQTTADKYNIFTYDKESVEVYDYLTTIIKAKFI